MKEKQQEETRRVIFNAITGGRETMLTDNLMRQLISTYQITASEKDFELAEEEFIIIDFGTTAQAALNDPYHLFVDRKNVNEEFSRLMEEEEAQKRRELQYALKANLIKPMPVPEDAADQQPPTKAESLLRLMLKAKDREVVIGDLAERYGKKVQQRGKLRADFWYYKQVIWSAYPLLQYALRKLRRLGAVR